jgi:hypothetical protein
MNGLAHRTIAEDVGTRWGLKGTSLEEFVSGSTYPDHVDDVMVRVDGKYWRTHFGPYRLCSLTHFNGVTSDGRSYGYCFGKDPGISVPKLKLGDLKARLPFAFKVQHPLDKLLALPGYASKRLTTITFPSSSEMGEYFAECVTEGEIPPFDGLGRIAHMAMDACVPHHVVCTLLQGHSEFEGKVDDLVRKMSKGEWGRMFKEGEKMSKERPDSSICELIKDTAKSTRTLSGASVYRASDLLCLYTGVRAACNVLRWAERRGIR